MENRTLSTLYSVIDYSQSISAPESDLRELHFLATGLIPVELIILFLMFTARNSLKETIV